MTVTKNESELYTIASWLVSAELPADDAESHTRAYTEVSGTDSSGFHHDVR